MNSEWSPIELDRKLARAFAQWRAWRLRRRETPDIDDDPLTFFRDVTGQSLFQKLGELPDIDPLKAPLRRWVYRLAEQRINHGLLTQISQAWLEPRHCSEIPKKSASHLGELLEQSLADGPRRAIWLRAFFAEAKPASALAIALWQRRREIARRMRVDSEASAPQTALTDMRAVAQKLAAVTRERVRELGAPTPDAFVERALGSDVPGSWPSKLSPERLLGYFRETDLLRSLELTPARLPGSMGAASVGRALGKLGAAWFEALAPRDQPFVVAHDPYGLGRHEASALFSLLLLSPRFLMRHFEIGKLAVPDVLRRLAQIWLLDLATSAFRVLVRPAALASERAFREAFSELAHADLHLTLPREVAGAFLTLGIEDEQRLLGQLSALRRTQELVEAHDEDWFRNPRAIERLRAEANRPPPTLADADAVASALRLAERELTRLLR